MISLLTLRSIKLWHDDTRPPPDHSWHWTRTNAQAIAALTTCHVVEASLDHDLEYAHLDVALIQALDEDQDFLLVDLVDENTVCTDNGLQLVDWMVANDRIPPCVRIHSWNPDAAVAMAAVLRSRTDVVVLPWCRDDAPV